MSVTQPLDSRSLETEPSLKTQSLGIPSNTLGRMAVEADDLRVTDYMRIDDKIETLAAETERSRGREAYEYITSIREKLIDEDLEKTRDKIAGLGEKQQGQFNFYCQTSAPNFLKGLKDDFEKDSEGMGWTSWLSTEASDDQLLNFLQWHTYAIEQLNRESEVTAEMDRERAEYKIAISIGIDEGWLHPDAHAAIDETDEVKMYVSDLFDTRFEDREGYYTHGSKVIIVGPVSAIPLTGDFSRITRSFPGTVKHELNHAVLGRFGSRWLNEAVTEHIAQVMNKGEPEILRPDERTYNKYDPTYANERDLLHSVLNSGREQIPLTMAMRAYSEEGDSGEEMKAFIDAIDRSWAHLAGEGESAYENLNKHINELEKQLREEGFSQISAGRQAAILVERLFRHQRISPSAETEAELKAMFAAGSDEPEPAGVAV